jgi:putative transposase
VVLGHQRRQIVHINVTSNPTAAWTAQQMVEAFPKESAPRYLIRGRDRIYGEEFRQRVKGMGIEEVITAARSHWQNPFAERVVGSLRRECLDHVIVLNENHLRLTIGGKLANIAQIKLKKNRLRYNQEVIRCVPDP